MQQVTIIWIPIVQNATGYFFISITVDSQSLCLKKFEFECLYLGLMKQNYNKDNNFSLIETEKTYLFTIKQIQ